jgi:hypothetical protein
MSTPYSLDDDLLSAGGLTVKAGCSRVGTRGRLASAKLVSDQVAVKRTWTFSYVDLPGQTADVLDGGLGRDDLRAAFDAGGACTLTVPVETGTDEDVSVLFSDSFSEQRTQVQPCWRWNLEFTLEEI